MICYDGMMDRQTGYTDHGVRAFGETGLLGRFVSGMDVGKFLPMCRYQRSMFFQDHAMPCLSLINAEAASLHLECLHASY